MQLINNRFNLIGEPTQILDHRYHRVKDLKDNGKIKQLTFYDLKKDKKEISYLSENFLEINNIKHKNLLESSHFHVVETIDRKKINVSLYFLIHEEFDGEPIYLIKDKLNLKERLNILLDLMNLIDYLHFKGSIYRYLSPDNLFISQDNKVKARSLAFVSGKDDFFSYQTMTEYFVSPELHQDLPNINYKVDYFSIGIIIKYLFLKDYKAKNIDLQDFIENFNLNNIEKSLLLNIIKNLTQIDSLKKDINLRRYIEIIISELNLDYKYNLKEERNTVDFDVNLKGREQEVKKVIENDKLLDIGNKVYSGILITGSKGVGKTRLIKELHFKLKMQGRQIIRLNIDYENKDNNINIKNLLNKSLLLASNSLMSKYNVEFNDFLREIINGKKDNSYSSKFKTRYRFFNRITNYLIELSNGGILYIIIDDIHNSDEEFLSLLKYLVINLKDKQVLFIFSCLEASMIFDSIVRDMLIDWDADKCISKINLKELDKQNFKNVIESKLGFVEDNKGLVSFLYDTTEGNLLKLDYIIKDLYYKNEIYINEKGNWETDINRHKNTFVYLDIHEILKKQLDKISKESLEFIKLASLFDKYILEDSIIEMMNSNNYHKDNILKELLKHNIIERDYDYNSTIYKFCNRELKYLLYNEIDRDDKTKLHKIISNIILRNLKEEVFILKELAFQLIKSNKENLALDLILKKARSKENKYSQDSIYLWELSYSIVKDFRDYESNYKTLYILNNLIEIYSLKGEKGYIEMYLKEIFRISKVQNNSYYLIKAKYYKAEEYFIKYRLQEIEILIDDIRVLSNKYNIIEGKIISLYIESKLCLRTNNWKMLLKTAEDLISLSEHYKKEKYLGNIYNILGLYHNFNGNNLIAIENFKRSIRYFNETTNIAELIKPINNIGEIYSDHFYDIDRALSFFKKGYNISERYELAFGKYIFSLNIGNIYLQKLQLNKALSYFEKANEISTTSKDFRIMFLSTIKLGIVYLNKDDIIKAYNTYIIIKDIFENTKIIDIELTSSYYDFLSEFHGYFGIWDSALKYANESKQLFQKFNMKDYCKSFLMEIYYKYCKEKDITFDQKDILFSLLKNYCGKRTNNDILIILLKFIQFGMINGDMNFANDILTIYNNLRPYDELYNSKLLRRSIENNIDFNEEELNELEILSLGKQTISIGILLHFNLGISLFKNSKYRKSIYHFLRCIEIMFKTIEYLDDSYLKKAFIMSRQGDLIKEYICNAIRLEFNKDINCIKIKDLKFEDVYEYFKLSLLINALNDKEIDSIFYLYNKNGNIKDIESLLCLMSDNFQSNLDNILKFISYKTLAEKGFIILYDNELNEYNVLSSLNTKDIKDFNLNKLVHLDRRKEGILLNKSSLSKNKQNNVGFFSKEIIGILGVPIGSNNFSINIKENRRSASLTDERYKGYIYLETSKYLNKFNSKNFKILKSLSNLIYLNVENHMLKNISTTDRLTGTLTRKSFESRLDKFIIGDTSGNVEFSLLMIDVDDFKEINDTYGHLKGDKVLKTIGAEFKNNIRITDLVGRYGGDEFIIALLNTSLKDGINIAENIIKRIGEITITGIEKKLSLTVGVSHYPTQSKFKKELMKKADEALYFAKDRLGKNVACAWDHSLSQKNENFEDDQNTYSEIMDINDKTALTITNTSNLIRKNISLQEKGYLFLEILLDALEADEGNLTFIDGTKIESHITKCENFNTSPKSSKYKLNIIQKVLTNKKGKCFIDWENYDGINPLTGAPDWKSIIYIPLVKNENIKGIVYLSVLISKKEFNINEFNLVKLLCNIFIANF